MQGCWFDRAAVSIFLACATISEASHAAQPAQSRKYSFPEADYIGQSEQAPDWIVWRALHGSLQFYVAQSPSQVQELLRTKLGVGSADATRFLNLGKQYIETSKRLEEQISKEIARRLGTRQMSPAATAEMDAAIRAKRTELTQRRAPSPQQRIESERGPPKVSMESALEQSGMATTIDSQRKEALAAHQQDVLQLLGREAYSRLLSFIDAEVRSNVRVAKGGTRVDPR